MRLAEHGGEGHGKNLFAEIVVDVQNPTTPVFRVGRHDERPHEDGGALMRLSQAAYRGAAPIDKYSFGMGVMEIDLSHVRPPFVKSEVQALMDSSGRGGGKSGRSRPGNYGEWQQF